MGVLYCCLAEGYILWDPEMSHANVLVCDGDQQQEAGPSFSKYGRLKLCRSASNVPTNRSTEYHQLPETGMVWTGCSTLSHNNYCGNSVIDGVLESSLSVTIDYNLLCIRVFIYK